jgi:hypothetical protein
MSRFRFNWQRKDSFEWKFKRKPKLRTISEIHDLYIRSMKRSEKKSKEMLDCIDEIVREVPSTNNSRYNDNRYIIYFYSDDILYQYEILYEINYGCYSSSFQRVKFDEGSVEEIIEKKIHFILNNQKALELGEKYRRLSKSNKYLHYNVKEALELMILESLEEKFKDIRVIDLPKAIPVIVGGKKYIFTIVSSYGTYKKFIFIGESHEDIVLD